MNIDQLLELAKTKKQTIAVAHATDASLFAACKEAADRGGCSFHFFGPMETMLEEASKADVTRQDNFEFHACTTDKESASEAVRFVSAGRAGVLMKGMLSTSLLLKAVLNKEAGLRTGRVLSHVAGFRFPEREKLLYLTDAAMNIAPSLKEKVQILENAVHAVSRIGVTTPKVAALAAVEHVNEAMPATLDAASLTMMNKRGQLTGCVVDGPLAFDIAVSEEAAKQKKVESDVAGKADILLAPSIEVGNSLYKSFTIFGSATVGGMIVGARAPIILTSRADSKESKLFSIALAVNAS
ncbi:bifunctional enoyl-CoA hydratase/phosphate acetyltransferase [Paenalkalicoccus suaedae]|uniref:Bifunctional enoyl-CoA hydratase/phosphate acetyltransferase n=1 Tax=Paenalkalicoccus suaedae TaxID=2592382 RepID=A0A859FFG3_9BACI|nr:bifunctional enoyl-CoA hydratase/phosphate acetyltransferase [Paenalkalicoccus suaedae]QKS70976.1 bifunctional enoyl-CoA hydratase/phosphate acetyltransferase [Paenalkalicoccus suaedae]